ncbi:dynein regulatory complex subunit 4 [Nematolebias whitei]|uniref:dynein regulatory complex subunit 4 n=1 Tax=Nematolebias whitei TaxID=451745 RepID=UPI00189894BA|nr:dynein regulatory complex subunit 4 [Nematolebias whitei]
MSTPPKRKDPSKKSASARPPTLINGLTKEELSKEQMMEHIARLQEELDREREERKFFQLERDKYHSMREITATKLEEVRAKLKTLERAAEEDDERYRVENEVYEQKLKHLLCEHQNTVSELKEARLVTADTLHEEQDELEDELSNSMRAIMVDMHGSDYENQVKELELKHQEEMAATRDNLERLFTETTAKYEEKMQMLQQEQEMMTDNQCSERELQWKSHIVDLTEDHNKFFRDTTTEANFKLKQDVEAIDELNEEIPKLKLEVRKMTQDTQSVLQENLHLTELLTKVRTETAYLEKKAKFCSEKKIKNPKIKVLKDLKADHGVLEQRFSKLQLERDELLGSFEQNVLRKQHEADLPNVLLERKLQTVKDRLEEVEAQLQSVLSAPNMDHAALIGLTNKMEVLLEIHSL